MPPQDLPADISARIETCVAKFTADLPQFEYLKNLLAILPTQPLLATRIHSSKVRVKDATHLRDKLVRKAGEALRADKEFEINEANVYKKVNDLVGLRLLHLHTTEFEGINTALKAALDAGGYIILEGPIARIWDLEYKTYFDSIRVDTINTSDRMYTSVHYVIAPNSHSPYTAEIQVRSLAEEIWGEVDHSINYPERSTKLACREQIKVLARVTSSCTRLVDSIFLSHREG